MCLVKCSLREENNKVCFALLSRTHLNLIVQLWLSDESFMEAFVLGYNITHLCDLVNQNLPESLNLSCSNVLSLSQPVFIVGGI